MARETIAQLRADEIVDAVKVRKATQKHLAVMARRGVSRDRLEAWDELIAAATKADKATGAVALDLARTVLKDLVGEYRAAADLFADGPERFDREAFIALQLNEPFPRNDVKLESFIAGLDAALDRYGAQLTASGFTKALQDQLLGAAARFHEEHTTLPLKRGERPALTVERDNVFEQLRKRTNWFRRVGRAALRNDKARADFDRVHAAAKAK